MGCQLQLDLLWSRAFWESGGEPHILRSPQMSINPAERRCLRDEDPCECMLAMHDTFRVRICNLREVSSGNLEARLDHLLMLAVCGFVCFSLLLLKPVAKHTMSHPLRSFALGVRSTMVKRPRHSFKHDKMSTCSRGEKAKWSIGLTGARCHVLHEPVNCPCGFRTWEAPLSQIVASFLTPPKQCMIYLSFSCAQPSRRTEQITTLRVSGGGRF